MRATLKKLAATAAAAVTAAFGLALPRAAGIAFAAEASVQAEDTLAVSLTALGGTAGRNPENPTEKSAVKYDFAEMYKKTGDALLADLTAADFPSGTEWTVMGLVRGGRTVPDSYYNNVLGYVSSKIDENGRLSRTGATGNACLILALTALGYDVTDVGGNDLLLGLSELEYVTKQGANGAIWGLIALDSGKYDIPKAESGTQTTRGSLVDAILAAQLEDGGWAYGGSVADPDLTAMALTALAPYIGEGVDETAVNGALALLSEAQTENGGFGGEDGTYSESCAQVLTALTALGIDPLTDGRFVKNGGTVLDAMAELYEDGRFRHTASGELNTLSSEQCFYAMAAYDRFANGKNPLFDMSDAKRRPVSDNTPSKPGANPDCGVSDSSAAAAAIAAALIIAAGTCGCSAAERGAASEQSAPQASYIGSSGTQNTPGEPPLSSGSDPSGESSAETPASSEAENVCMFSICCAEALEADALSADMRELLPTDGVIFAARTEFSDGETVFDVLRRVCRENRIHMESSSTPLYGSVYIKGIANLYESDCGTGSGWVFTVNGVSPGFGSGSFALSPGDVVEWKYTVEGIE